MIAKIEASLQNDSEVYVSHIERLESLLREYTNYYVSMLEMTERAETWAEDYAACRLRLSTIFQQIESLEAAVTEYENVARDIDKLSRSL